MSKPSWKLLVQSERTAQRKTKATRDRQNTERDTQIIALHEQGKSYREIHTETGTSFGTVSNVVKAYKKRQTAISSTNSSLAETVHPTNTADTGVDSETLHTPEVEPDHDKLFKLLDVSACFYGKHQLSASEVSQFTGIDESEVCEILDEWYETVVISPGIGEKYWMSESDEKKLWDKILGPTLTEWGQNFPGQKILCPPVAFNPHLNPKNTF